MKTFWLNLPVKDVNRSSVFFTALGFKFNTQQGNGSNSACLLIVESNVVCKIFFNPKSLTIWIS